MAEITIKGRKARVSDRLAAALVKAGKAQYADALAVEETKDEDISPRTGKPKRTYRRRDMAAEG